MHHPMKRGYTRYIYKLSYVAFLLLFSCGNVHEKTGRAEKKIAEAELLANGRLTYIELSGTPYEIGCAHGIALKKEIKAVTDSLRLDIERSTGMKSDEFISKFLAETDFLTSIRKWTPDLIEEIKGISDGSGVDFSTILMHQLGDEFFFNTEYIMAHKCSSIGVERSDYHPTITAQNMDIPTYFHGYQTVMKISDQATGLEKLILTIPGHVGITGMNSAGVSINCNILMQLNYSSKGLPVSAMVRGVIDRRNVNDAVEFVNEVDHASGQNYLIGGRDAVYSLECSSTEVTEFQPFDSAHFTYHTNHPLVNKSFSPRYLEILDEQGITLTEALSFCRRLPSFSARFNEETKDFGVEEIKEVLSSRDHDGEDVVSNTFTYASVIYELGDSPIFHIASGKPHETPFIELEF